MNNISRGTIIRTACLILALVNNALAIAGKSPLPIDNEVLSQVIAFIFTAVTSLVAWWKNNSITKAAIDADEVLKNNKAR